MEKFLSVCIIARDEETFIRSAIRSVLAIANEIIVVDTGSKDKTKEIALAEGARVVEHEWQNDFAESKNFAMEQADCKWVLMLDADEELFIEDGEKLLNALKADPEDDPSVLPQTILLEFVDMVINENYSLPRVIRRSSHAKYRGKVHEMLYPEDLRSISLDVRILHKGYASEVVKRKDKVTRNLALMKEIETADPNDHINNFHLGALHQSLGENAQAISYYNKIINAGAGKDNPKVYKCLVRTYEAAKDLANAKRVAEEGLKLFPYYSDLWFHLGIDSFITGDLKTARTCFQRCMLTPSDAVAPTRVPGTNSVLARLFLALTDQSLAPNSETNKHLDEIMQELSKDADALFYLGKIFISAYGLDAAKKQLRDIADLKEPSVKRIYRLLFP